MINQETKELKAAIHDLTVALAIVQQNLLTASSMDKDHEARIRNIEQYVNKNLENKDKIDDNTKSIKAIESKMAKFAGAIAVIVPVASGVVSWLVKLLG